eukprot:5427413-Alexandrium_andersonii.AAC.1
MASQPASAPGWAPPDSMRAREEQGAKLGASGDREEACAHSLEAARNAATPPAGAAGPRGGRARK